MTESFSTLRINADRMLATFSQLASIGATGDGGVSRITFSEAHLAARKWFRNEIENSDLNFAWMVQGIILHFLRVAQLMRRLFCWVHILIRSQTAAGLMVHWG